MPKCREVALASSLVLALSTQASLAETRPSSALVPVTVQNFTRAESDKFFAAVVKRGGFGKFDHNRAPTPIEEQDVVRMNRDTLYSGGVFDLDRAPVTITLPDAGKRFMSLLIVSEDHDALPVVYAPGRFTFTKDKVGTRYMMAIVRTLADPKNPRDIQAANALQDRIVVEQASSGSFEVPNWDPTTQTKLRDALLVLASMQGDDGPAKFGRKNEVDPVSHLINTASGWGGNPLEAARYVSVYPKANDGKTVHKTTVKDVPVDGFWSITVYDQEGHFIPNDLGVYSLNNLGAKVNTDGSVTVQFGECRKDTQNCLPIAPGWNYTVRLYRPRKAIVNNTWKFPEAKPVE
jgi:para-nitrobenzyl esterase